MRSALSTAVLLFLCVGAFVRLAACRNDLWFDELWSFQIARSLDSALDVFTVGHNNNHYLNTLVFYVLGEGAPPLAYRIPSFLAGLGSMLLAGAIARTWGRLEAATAVALTACSYLLIHYSSEARGYSGAVLFSFLGLHALLRHARTRSGRDAAVFWLAVLLGFLSHLEFVHFFSAAVLWSAWNAWRARRTGVGLLRELARLHALPLAGLVLLYWIDVRHMQVGGGPRYELSQVLIETASYMLGGPANGGLAPALGALALLLALLALRQLWRRGDDLWLFFAVVLFLSPSALLLMVRHDVLFVRYFLVGASFFLLLLALLFARLARAGRLGRWAAALLILAFLGGNAWHTTRLLREGRGQYMAALQYMDSHSSGEIITVGSDHDLRNGVLVDFYAGFLPPGRVRYVLQTERVVPDWLLLHRIGARGAPPESLQGPGRCPYRLTREFPYSALSGWHWMLYRRVVVESASSG